MAYQTSEIVPETLYYLSGVFLSDAQMEGSLLEQLVGQKWEEKDFISLLAYRTAIMRLLPRIRRLETP